MPCWHSENPATCADPTRAYLHLSIIASLANPLPIRHISELLGPGEEKDVETALVQLRSARYPYRQQLS
jgi:hypothetical protein